MDIALLCRSHFVDLPEATAEHIAANAYRIRVPLDAEVRKRSRRGEHAEDWDGAVFTLDGRETEPATGSGEGKGYVEVTALVFE